VLDADGDFASRRCNPGSVQLLPASGDEERLFTLISRHAALTGSPRGKWILENWEQMRQQFVKVYPNDLRAAAPEAQRKDSIHA